MIPNCCSYRIRYNEMDKKINAPVYGDKTRWDNHLIKESKKRKIADFANKTHWNDRLNRALVHIRPNMVRNIVKT